MLFFKHAVLASTAARPLSPVSSWLRPDHGRGSLDRTTQGFLSPASTRLHSPSEHSSGPSVPLPPIPSKCRTLISQTTDAIIFLKGTFAPVLPFAEVPTSETLEPNTEGPWRFSNLRPWGSSEVNQAGLGLGKAHPNTNTNLCSFGLQFVSLVWMETNIQETPTTQQGCCYHFHMASLLGRQYGGVGSKARTMAKPARGPGTSPGVLPVQGGA